MSKLLIPALLIALSACQSRPSYHRMDAQPQLDVPTGAQSIMIAAPPQTVHAALISSAQQKGTPVIQDQPNMIVMEREMPGKNEALDSEFGPSDNGMRVIRIRIRFTGDTCKTFAVQDLAVINNVRTALEQSFVLPGNPNTMESLRGLKSRAEQSSSCPPV